MSVSQIARKEGISTAYLEQILNSLKKKGFVKSVRGPQGGYVLTKKPSEIDLKVLFHALENNTYSVKRSAQVSSEKKDEIFTANDLFWKKFNSAFEESLSSMNVKDLLDEARQIHKGKAKASPQTFNI